MKRFSIATALTTAALMTGSAAHAQTAPAPFNAGAQAATDVTGPVNYEWRQATFYHYANEHAWVCSMQNCGWFVECRTPHYDACGRLYAVTVRMGRH